MLIQHSYYTVSQSFFRFYTSYKSESKLDENQGDIIAIARI